MWGEATGQGWSQIGELGLAFVLSAAIGLEREVRQKSAGMRTHTLVGLGAALIMLVSKYGFSDVLGHDTVLDPSRVAAQIVSGIGFIGGGLIFVRQDVVRGLTTAAVVWMTAAIGMAAGAGLPVLALVVAGAHFLIVLGFAPLAARIPGSTRSPPGSGWTTRTVGGAAIRPGVLHEDGLQRGRPVGGTRPRTRTPRHRHGASDRAGSAAGGGGSRRRSRRSTACTG